LTLINERLDWSLELTRGVPLVCSAVPIKEKGRAPREATVNHRQNLALSAQSTRTLQHREGLSRAPNWPEKEEEEEQRKER